MTRLTYEITITGSKDAVEWIESELNADFESQNSECPSRDNDIFFRPPRPLSDGRFVGSSTVYVDDIDLDFKNWEIDPELDVTIRIDVVATCRDGGWSRLEYNRGQGWQWVCINTTACSVETFDLYCRAKTGKTGDGFRDHVIETLLAWEGEEVDDSCYYIDASSYVDAAVLIDILAIFAETGVSAIVSDAYSEFPERALEILDELLAAKDAVLEDEYGDTYRAFNSTLLQSLAQAEGWIESVAFMAETSSANSGQEEAIL